MNYYKRHLGDYAKKAGHLSPLEHGVYTLLLDAYYDREQGPTRLEAIRWCRARTEDEIAAVDAVLAEFFDENEGRFTQTRVEEEILAYHTRAEANGLNGAKGGRPKKTEEKPIGFPDESDEKAKLTLATSHKPILNSKPHVVCEQTPHEEIIALYHETLPMCPRVRKWTAARQQAMRARWRENPDLDYWRNFFVYVSESEFLTGKSDRRQGSTGPPFLADLEWLINSANHTKTVEGKYHRE